MIDEKLLLKLEGLHTVDTVSDELGITRQSAINLLSRLKKKGYAKSSGGGKQARFYRISTKKFRKRDPGMFDIINKYNPHMKLNPWYDHQVHGEYGPEEALIDAVKTESFRVIIASLRLFNHIKDWKKLYRLANEENVWQKVGALYDVARKFIRVRKMPEKFSRGKFKKKQNLIKDYPTKDNIFEAISKKWNVEIPFRRADFQGMI